MRKETGSYNRRSVRRRRASRRSLTLTTWPGQGLFNFSKTGFTVPSGFTADCPNPNMDCAAETTILAHLADPSVATADAKGSGGAGLNGRRGASGVTAPLTAGG